MTRRTPADASTDDATDGIAVAASPLLALEALDLAGAAARALVNALNHPRALLDQYVELARDLARIVVEGKDDAAGLADRRFADPAWSSHGGLRRLKLGYRRYADCLRSIPDLGNMKVSDRELSRWGLSLYADMIAPTNFLATNPTALDKAVRTRGASLAAGAANLLGDILRNGGKPSQVDSAQFELGRNIAATKGQVVYRNDVLELLQFTPVDRTVKNEPLLFMPSPVNRYYVFDLSPSRSMIEYTVGQGFTVFALSFRNPSVAQRGWGIEAYVAATIEAIDAICDITGAKSIHAAAACAGGINLIALLSVFKHRGDERIRSATFLVSLFDTADSEGVFGLTTRPLAARAAARSARRGVVTDRTMFWMFALLRPNDALWGYWVNNYLLGNRPPAHDLLYWANDHTNLAARMHADLLGVYLAQGSPASSVMGAPVDPEQISVDVYGMAAIQDHVMPWQGCYRTLRKMRGRKTFVLHTRGHVTSMVHPPDSQGGAFFLRDDQPLTDDALEWKSGASKRSESWWPHWTAWLAARSSGERMARKKLGNQKHVPLCDAPGTYVHSR